MLKELYQEIAIFQKVYKIKSVSYGCVNSLTIFEKLHVVISNWEHNSLFACDYVIIVIALIHFFLLSMLLLFFLYYKIFFRRPLKRP